jgi:hypothetical protein
MPNAIEALLARLGELHAELCCALDSGEDARLEMTQRELEVCVARLGQAVRERVRPGEPVRKKYTAQLQAASEAITMAREMIEQARAVAQEARESRLRALAVRTEMQRPRKARRRRIR